MSKKYIEMAIHRVLIVERGAKALRCRSSKRGACQRRILRSYRRLNTRSLRRQNAPFRLAQAPKYRNLGERNRRLDHGQRAPERAVTFELIAKLIDWGIPKMKCFLQKRVNPRSAQDPRTIAMLKLTRTLINNYLVWTLKVLSFKWSRKPMLMDSFFHFHLSSIEFSN